MDFPSSRLRFFSCARTEASILIVVLGMMCDVMNNGIRCFATDSAPTAGSNYTLRLTRLTSYIVCMKTYSTYEAKAKFSEILRQVREGRTVRVSYRGAPVAEIRPIGGADSGLARRLERLAERGVLIRATGRAGTLDTVRRRPGSLKRFLDDRGE